MGDALRLWFADFFLDHYLLGIHRMPKTVLGNHALSAAEKLKPQMVGIEFPGLDREHRTNM